MTLSTLTRSSRSTRRAIAVAEGHQSAVIAALTFTGNDAIAGRITRCQHDRRHPHAGQYPWRCRSAGCWACRRIISHRWWRAFHDWIVGAEISLAIIPVQGDPLRAIRKLRKACVTFATGQPDEIITSPR